MNTQTTDSTAPRLIRRKGHVSRLRKLLVVPAVLVGLALMFLIVVTPLDLQSQALLGAVGFTLFFILNRFKGRSVTLILIFVSIIVSSRYMHWRLSSTLAWEWSIESVMAPLLLLAEVYAYIVLLLGYLQTAWPLDRMPAPMPEDPNAWPTVDIFIPTYNEPLKVVRTTVLAAKQIDWPTDKLRIYILDDGRRGEFRSFAAAAKVGYLVRPDNQHAKAGNINHALTQTRGEYIAVFDCDHIPTRSFLQLTLGWFLRDEKLGMVQTPHHFHSSDPFERNLGSFKYVPNEGELFYGLIQPGNDLWNATFFCGSCAVLRRTILEVVGGVAVETVTEDAHTALKMHRRGYNTAYLSLPQASGLATESLSAHIGQRIRWARGMAQIFRIDNPLFGRGLTLPQRLAYANAMLYFFNALPRIVFLLAPLSYLLFGAHIFNAAPLMVVAYALPHLAHALMTNVRMQGRYRHSFWAEVYETVLAFYIVIPTTLALIAPRLGRFNVTAKGGLVKNEYFDFRIAWPYLLLFLLNLFGFSLGAWHVVHATESVDPYLMNMFWALFNIMILGSALAVAWEKRQVRVATRTDVSLPVMLRLESGRTVAGRTADLSMSGAGLNIPDNLELKTDDPVTVSVLMEGDEYPLPARVVRTDGSRLRVLFDSLTLEEETWLVGALYSRWNAWLGWHDEHPKDNMLVSFLKVLRQSFRGTFRTFFGLLRGRRQNQEVAG